MTRTRHTNRLLVRHVVYAKGNHLLGYITFDNADLGPIPVMTVVLQDSHLPLKRVHLVEKDRARIIYLTHNMYNEMDHDIKER
jgi:hypothetical protein